MKITGSYRPDKGVAGFFEMAEGTPFLLNKVDSAVIVPGPFIDDEGCLVCITSGMYNYYIGQTNWMGANESKSMENAAELIKKIGTEESIDLDEMGLCLVRRHGIIEGLEQGMVVAIS